MERGERAPNVLVVAVGLQRVADDSERNRPSQCGSRPEHWEHRVHDVIYKARDERRSRRGDVRQPNTVLTHEE